LYKLQKRFFYCFTAILQIACTFRRQLLRIIDFPRIFMARFLILKKEFVYLPKMEPLHNQYTKPKKQTAVANHIVQSKLKNASFQLLDNRPKTVIQQKIQDQIIQKKAALTSQHYNASSSLVIQLGKKKNNDDKKKKDIGKVIKTAKKKRKSRRALDDESKWIPPNEQRNHRQAFSKKLRRQVIMSGAPRNKNNLYVCPACGRPLADAKGNEIITYYISKAKKRHNIVSAQLDHYPPWKGRLKKLKAKRKSDEEIRKDHDDPSRLRPLCHKCNLSHKYENVKDIPKKDFSNDTYHSDDEERDKEIYKKLRKDDHDKDGPGSGTGITV